MDDPMVLPGGVRVPLDAIELRVSRSSGPGGQHANVTASRVEAVLDVEAAAALDDDARLRLRARVGARVTAVAQDARSQARNRELALERLRAKLVEGLTVQRARTRTRPTRASKVRRVDAKKRRGAVKQARRRPDAD